MSSSPSRRVFLRDSLLVAGLSATGLPARAATAASGPSVRADAEGLVLINANEHPEGPAPPALQAITAIAPHGGRYLGDLQQAFIATIAAQLGVPADHIRLYAGSSEPLSYAMLAFTSPQAPLVTADVTYEAAWRAAGKRGARVIKVPLRGDDAHDVRALCAAAPDAGVLYICNPNNPTGAVTVRADIEHALAHKPHGSVLVVDEAYIHFSDSATSMVDRVAAGDDVLVLRTFSKLYGMAGIRLGYAVARPELLAKLDYFGSNSVPVTAVAAGLASVRDPQLVPRRRAANAAVRTDVVAFLTAQGYACTSSESNCFMVDVKRPAAGFARDMASHGVLVGRSWEAWPNSARITVGSVAEMARFKQAFTAVAAGRLGTRTAAAMEYDPGAPAITRLA